MSLSETIATGVIAGIISGLFSGAGTALLVEAYKANLARKARYYKFQYDLYNKLWNSLYDLQQSGSKLWLLANLENLRNFGDQLVKTQDMVSRNALLIEGDHYNKLQELIHNFWEFNFGKAKLIDLRENPQSYAQVDNRNIETTIRDNEKAKRRYEKLLSDIAKSFRNQIKSP